MQGMVYDEHLTPVTDALVEITTLPMQKVLAKTGSYSFDVAPGTYHLRARKAGLFVEEEITITREGTFTYDVFLIPDLAAEEDLWKDIQEEIITPKDENLEPGYALWRYVLAVLLGAFALWRFARARKKYGPLRKFRKRMKEEATKTVAQHKEELAREPGYIEQVLDILKKHDGRITQKELRKEMLYLSEAKVSLLVTELEHKGKIEKVKKGRGNVLLLKEHTGEEKIL